MQSCQHCDQAAEILEVLSGPVSLVARANVLICLGAQRFGEPLLAEKIQDQSIWHRARAKPGFPDPEFYCHEDHGPYGPGAEISNRYLEQMLHGEAPSQ